MISQLQQAMTQLNNNYEQLSAHVENDIVQPARDAYEKNQKEMRYNDFSGKYGDKFAPYSDTMKALEGDDFDLTRSAFDAIDGVEGANVDDYVNNLVAEIEGQVAQLKKSLGMPETAEVNITDAGDGEVKVEADGKEVATEGAACPECGNEPCTCETPAEGEAPVEGEEGDDAMIDESEMESDPAELAALEEELSKLI